MAHAKEIPSGPPPELAMGDGPAGAWMPNKHEHQQDAKEWQPNDHEVIGLDDTIAIGGGMIDIQRCGDREVGALMGKAWRNPVTGTVQIKAYGGFQDFCVADLWTRPSLQGSASDLAGDPYLFRPFPMGMRTWIYHHLFRMGKVLDCSGAEEDAMIRYILGMHCIDADKSAGRWAPVMLYVPMILFLTIAADLGAAIVAILVLALVLAIQWIMNTPELYRWSRPVHLPLRIVLFFQLIEHMGAKSAAGGSAASQLGFIIAIAFCVGEIVIGDGGALGGYRLHCSYEVIRVLPNRIFVCRRHGAAHSADILGRSLPVNEKITGMGNWQPDFVLIADVKGLIVELRPMSINDWKLVFTEKMIDHETIHRYIGLDVYSPGAATIDSLNAAIYETQMMAQKKKMMNDDDMQMHDA